MINPYDSVPLGQSTDPLSTPDNQVSYADITKFQLISQYQQQNQNYPRSSARYTRMISAPRFQYGINNQQDINFYSRQMETSRNVYSSGIAKGLFDYASYGMASSALTAVGVGGAAGFFAPMAIPIAPLFFINKGIDRTLERQRAMQQISSDIEQYREKIGLPNLSYNQASALGSNLASSIFSRGQFFDPQKQQEILKYGLSNDMLSGKSRGMASGDIKTFEKNFKELLDTVAKVSKTLKVTSDGALSVIKEMQMGGFGNMNQISGAITSAKAFGSMSGLGTQNMLEIGKSGALSVLGTPFTAASGASMYMANAAMAGYMARGNNLETTKSVQMVGGIGQAGGILAQTQMNFLMSGVGARVLASVMDKNQHLDINAFNNLLTGNQSGHEIIARAAQNAHGWSSGGRVMFARNRAEIANQLAEDPIALAKTFMKGYEAWGSNRRGDYEQQAQVFAQNFTQGGLREQNLMADWIKGPKHFEEMRNSESVARAVHDDHGYQTGYLRRRLNELEYRSYSRGGLTGDLIDLGSDSAMQLDADLSGATRAFGGLGRRVKNYGLDVIENALSPVTGGRKLFNRRNIGTVEEGYKGLYGLTPNNYTIDDYKRAALMTAGRRRELGLISPDIIRDDVSGWKAGSAFLNMSSRDLQDSMQQIQTAMGNGVLGNLAYNASFVNTMGYNSEQINYRRKNPNEIYNDAARIVRMAQSVEQTSHTKVQKSIDYFQANAGIDLEAANAFYANIRSEDRGKVMAGVISSPLGSKRRRDLMYINQYVNAQNDLSKISSINQYLPGSMVNVQQAQNALNLQAKQMMGMNTVGYGDELKKFGGLAAVTMMAGGLAGPLGLLGAGAVTIGMGVAASRDWRRDINKRTFMQHETGIDSTKDPVAALAALSEKFLNGDYGNANPKKQSQIIEALMIPKNVLGSDPKLQFANAAEWYRKNGGEIARNLALNTQDLKLTDAYNKKGLALANEIGLKGAGYSEADAKAAREYIKSGVFSDPSGKLLSIGMANAIAESQGMTGKAVLEMGRRNTLTDNLYGPSKQLVTSTKLNELDKQMGKLLDSTIADSKNAFTWIDSAGVKHIKSSKEDAMRAIKEEKEAIMSLQKPKSPYENTDGKSLNSIVSAPILNYWNNKWSL